MTINEIQAHPGKKIIDKLHGFNATSAVLSGNLRELISLVEKLENPNDPLNVLGTENRHLLEQKFTEVYRLLHNFLAAAATLVDHTRRLMDQKTINAAHKTEHMNDVKVTFESNPLSRFVKDFRNYVLHRDRPEILLTIYFMEKPTRHKLQIDLEPMLTWPKWSPQALIYISNHSPSIRIIDFIQPYGEKVRVFGNDFIDRFSNYYRGDIDEAVHLMQEWNSRISPQPSHLSP